MNFYNGTKLIRTRRENHKGIVKFQESVRYHRNKAESLGKKPVWLTDSQFDEWCFENQLEL